MTKISKKDQDPNQVKKDAEGIAKLLAMKSDHFTLNSWVIKAPNIRGQITRMSKDGGTKFWIDWEDGTTTMIPNPRNRTNWGKPVTEIDSLY